GGGIRIGLERIADDDRHLVLHFFGRAGGDEDVGRIALAPFRLGLRRLRLGEREADLVAAGRGGIRAPVAVLAEQGGLRIACCRRRRCGRGRFGRRGGWFRRLRRGGGLLRLRRGGGFRRLLLREGDRRQRCGEDQCGRGTSRPDHRPT